jgi:ATP-binding cassette subfamily B multidrug efflux pump
MMMRSGMSGGGGPAAGPGSMPGRAGMEMARARDPKGSLSKLFGYLGPHRKALIGALILAVGSTAANIVGPRILGEAVTVLSQGVAAQISGGGAIDFARIAQILLAALSIYVLSALFYYLHSWIMANVATSIAYRLRREISEKIHRLPLRYFDGVTRGEVLSRITNDVDTINQTLSQSLSQIVISLVTVIGVLVMMLSINWLMALLALITIPLSMIASMLILRRSQPLFKQQQGTLGHVNGQVEETYGGHLVVQAFNQEEPSMRRLEVANHRLYEVNWKSQSLSGMLMPIMTFIGNLGYVIVAVAGVRLAILRVVAVGDILALIQYVRSFTQPITQLANSSGILQQAAVAAERVFEFLAEAEEAPETTRPVKLEQVQGRVEFKDVHFGYHPERMIINDFSARVEPGQKIAIVGPTGAGKTTMVKLLMRFYEVNEGAILVDGCDIRDFTRSDLRRAFGMVLQDTWLYNGTILENIRYGRLDATDEEVFAAARAAHVDHFVHTLPDGYQMVLNEETSNISQGQMQLLTIARAVLADPRILILDEATSSVDTRTEILIQRAMDNLMQNRTSFVIAHRLSTIRDADRILVMRDGNIVEQGEHEELLARGRFYAELYHSQFVQAQAV